MPLRGLTLSRLKENIRKWSALYAAGLVVCLMLTNLLYTTTRPQVAYERQVLFYMADSYTSAEPLQGAAAELLAFGQALDETLEEVTFESLMYSDPEQDYTSAYMLMTRVSLGNGDIYLASSLAAEALMRSEGVAMPLEEALEDGWMAGTGLEPVSWTSEETGETHVLGLRLDSLESLRTLGAMNNEGAVLIVSDGSTNLETSMAVAEEFVKGLMEGRYARPEA